MAGVHRIYDQYARTYDKDRNRSLMERSYLREVISRLRKRAHVLDLGCGGGEPIARFFVEGGCQVTGVDAAPALVNLCRERFPQMTWIDHDMRTIDLGRRFDAVLAWDSFFHLTADDQRAMFPVFEMHTAPTGLLLFTSGPGAGEAIGSLYGYDLYHASLDTAEYRRLLKAHDFEVLMHRVEDPDCGLHTVWLAQRGSQGGK